MSRPSQAGSGSWEARLPHPTAVRDAGRGRRLHQMFETHDVLVSDAQKDVVVVPEHRPSVFPVYLSRLNLALELKFVAAKVDSICLGCSHFVRQLPSS